MCFPTRPFIILLSYLDIQRIDKEAVLDVTSSETESSKSYWQKMKSRIETGSWEAGRD